MVSSVLTLGPPKSTKASGTAESTSISYHFRLEVGLIDRRRSPYRYYWNRGGEPGGYLSAPAATSINVQLSPMDSRKF